MDVIDCLQSEITIAILHYCPAEKKLVLSWSEKGCV